MLSIPIGSVYVPPDWEWPWRKSGRRTVALARKHGSVSAALIQRTLGLRRNAADRLLTRLVRAGKLARIKRGLYVIPEAKVGTAGLTGPN